MARKTNIYFIFGAVVVLILGLAAIFGVYGWFLGKQQRVLTGTARPTFPYGDYSLEELNKMYPQTANENVPTTQSPEETHKKFLAALKAGNFDEAVNCCFREGDRENIKFFLEGVKNRGQVDLMITDLSEIETDFVGDTKATYVYSGTLRGEKVANFLTFIKNNRGVWLIESL